MDFELDPRLAADTTVVGEFPLCRVLLAREDLGPWLILVPRRAGLREIHHLDEIDQLALLRESSATAAMLESEFAAEKINIGALGNLVPQLHVHHIARFSTDPAWPGPVWGNTPGIARLEGAQAELGDRVAIALAGAGLERDSGSAL